jgi:hypothetical protein
METEKKRMNRHHPIHPKKGRAIPPRLERTGHPSPGFVKLCLICSSELLDTNNRQFHHYPGNASGARWATPSRVSSKTSRAICSDDLVLLSWLH